MIIKNLFILLLISISLVACGRRGALQQLEPSGYPHYYPMTTTQSFGDGGAVNLAGSALSDSETVSEITDNLKQNGSNYQDLNPYGLNPQLGLSQYVDGI